MTNERIRKIAPTRPYIFLHGVDDEVVTNVPTALIWGHCDIKTSELHYVEGDDRIIVRRGGAGLYEISVSLCVEKKTANPGHSKIELYVNGVVLDCSETHGYMGGVAEHGNAILIYTVYLSENDYIQTFVSVDNGSGQIEPNTGRFRMKMLSMDGWDNDAGGIRVTKRGWL
jgi:hypothetical protein